VIGVAELKIKVPKSVERGMEKFPEINWQGFLEKSVERKIEHLSRMEELHRQLEEEEELIDWTVKLQRLSRRGRFDELKRKGLI